MVDDKIKGLLMLYPLGMPSVELVLPLYEINSFMIQTENEFSSHEVVPLLLQSSDNCIELLVISGVLPLCIIKLFAKESYRPFLLR